MPAFGLNQYQRTAQLNPALLAVAPLLMVAVVWAPKALGLFGALGSFGVIAALPFLLMQIARRMGRALEARYNLGAGVTVAALRHGDSQISEATRVRYHATLKSHGLQVPSAEEQDRNPTGADATYADAVSWLREQTRDEKKYSLVHIENRTYGFRRNLRGLKPIGLAICAAAGFLDLTLILRAHPDGNLLWAAWIVFFVLAAGCATWVWIVTRTFVLDSSQAYALRLLAALDALPQAPKARTKGTS